MEYDGLGSELVLDEVRPSSGRPGYIEEFARLFVVAGGLNLGGRGGGGGSHC